VLDGTFANAEPPQGWRAAVAVVRTPVAPAVAAEHLRAALGELDATLPVTLVTMTERLRGVTMRPRFHAWLLAAFAATGLVLAAIGLFGVMSYLVAQRRRELGVRVALGATPRDLWRLVLGQAGRWILWGTVGGLAMAFGSARAIRSMLAGVEPTDGWAWGGAVILLGVTGLMAAAWPAWQASRVDAAVALKQE
jgi:putative ABC transport system permease protein